MRTALVSFPMIVPALALLALSTAPPALPQEPPPPPSPGIDWKDLTKSGLPLRFYGFLRLDAYYNTARMNNIILPATVSPENGTTVADDDDAGFALDPRLTRFGFDLLPGEIAGTTVAGKLEIDFANFPTGSSESRATPRIRLAYLDLSDEALGLRVGQDWDVVSPLFPAVNGEFLMWNAGNTGDRRAQIQTRWAPKEGPVDVKAALALTGAITNEDLDPTTGVTAERDGFDSGLPQVQLRAGLKLDGPVEKKPIDLGLWGAWGRTETDSTFGGDTRFDVYLAGLDFTLPLAERFSLRGEGWAGQNLGDFRGGIGQSINVDTGDEVRAVGGWTELAYLASDRLRFHAGGTIDDPTDGDVRAPTGTPTVFSPEQNTTAYVGTILDWSSGLRTGFDVIYWDTDWKGTSDGDGLRFNLYFQYNF